MTVTDRDGKSKTASAVDNRRYPEQNETASQDGAQQAGPSYDQIAQKAHELWEKRGCPDGSADQDWADAEQELRAAMVSKKATNMKVPNSGSVQR